jgi:ankyrin repeat protein
MTVTGVAIFLVAMAAVLGLFPFSPPRVMAGIPIGPEARTQKDYLKDKQAWLEGTSVAAFEKSSKKDAPWNAAAGCDDPVVLRWCGEVLVEQKDYKQAEEALRKAMPGLEKGLYPKTHTYFASQKLAEALRKRPGTMKEANQLTTTTLESLIGAVTTGEFGGTNVAMAYRQMAILFQAATSGQYDSRWTKMASALESSKDPDPWLLRMVQGSLEMGIAWRARGNGYADTVTEKGQQDFDAHMAKARGLLTEAWKLHPEFPQAADLMIGVTMCGQGNAGDTPRLWFERAVQAQADYTPAYSNMTLSIQPEWGGSNEKMEAFGLECLATDRFDTDVPLNYLVMLRGLARVIPHDGWRAVFRKPGVPENLQRLSAGLLAEKTRTKQHDWLLAEQAVAEAWCGNYENAARLMKDLPVQVDLAPNQKYWGLSLARNGWDWPMIEAEVRAFTGPQKETLHKAEELALAENVDQALLLFEQAMDASKDDPEVYRYLRERVAATRMGIHGDELRYMRWERPPLVNAAFFNYPDVVKFLVEKGTDLDARGVRGGGEGTALVHAVSRGNTSIATLLIEKGANLDLASETFLTPLHHAVRNNQADIVRMLVEHGANTTLKNDANYTALGQAIWDRHQELAKMLIPSGAAIDQPCANDYGPLCMAVQQGLPELAALLVEKGADVNAASGDKWTPLLIAAYHGDAATVRLLLAKGANAKAALGDGKTALSIAQQRNHPEVAQLLTQATDPVGIPAAPSSPKAQP